MLIDQIIELFTVVGLGLTLMLPLANPLTSMTLLLSLGSQIPWQERNRQIKQAAVYVVLRGGPKQLDSKTVFLSGFSAG